MHSENPKISNFHWVTKLNFGGVPNFERFRKNAHVDQRFTAFSASPPLRWPQAPDAEPIANLAANVGGLDRQALRLVVVDGRRSRRMGHPCSG